MNTLYRLTLMGFVSTLVMSCGAPPVKTVEDGQITPDQLYIVDCLLPPQIRQLGQNYTYTAPRKPAKLSAHDCALRGGEYVAYDKASFSSVANVPEEILGLFPDRLTTRRQDCFFKSSGL